MKRFRPDEIGYPAHPERFTFAYLSLIGRISLFRRFSEEFIPPAVWWEVVEQGGDRPGATGIRDACESIRQSPFSNHPQSDPRLYSILRGGVSTHVALLAFPVIMIVPTIRISWTAIVLIPTRPG